MRSTFFPLLVALFLTATNTFSQVPNPTWCSTADGADYDLPVDMFVDQNGFIYVFGTFYSPTITFGSNVLTGFGGPSAFLVKYNDLGFVQWAQSFGGEAVAITGSNENIYLTGPTSVRKLDGDGTVLWGIGITVQDDFLDFAEATGIDVNFAGDVTVSGTFQSDQLRIGPSPWNAQNSISDNGNLGDNIFLFQCSPNGIVNWVTANGSDLLFEDVKSTTSAIDGFGNVFVAGTYDGVSLTFGNGTMVNSSAGFREAFVAKYGIDGSELWVASPQGRLGHESIKELAVTPTGDVIVAGVFDCDTLTFWPFVQLVNPAPNQGQIFVTKFNYDGSLNWTKSIGGTEDNFVAALTDTEDGSLLLARDDLQLERYDQAGTFMSGYTYGINSVFGTAYTGSIGTSSGSVVVAGAFSDSLTIGSCQLADLSTSSSYATDVFLVTLSEPIATSVSRNYTELQPSLVAMPNPTNGLFTLPTVTGRNNSLALYNSIGQLEFYMESISGTTPIDCAHLSSGSYFIKVTELESGANSFTRLIVQRSDR